MVEEELGSRITTTVYEDQYSYAPLARIEHAKDNQAITEKQIFYYHTDINGAPEELTNYNGDVAWKARYRTWGNTVIEEWDQEFQRYDGTWQPREQNLRLQGQYRDIETGLHYNTFRYFDPDIGRFASQDPIGLEGGVNLYLYGPNPSHWIDPFGWYWNYFLKDSKGKVYYRGRAGDNQSMQDVVRRHSKTSGADGPRFKTGDRLHQITKVGTDYDTVRGIEDSGIRENKLLGRRSPKVRGNLINGISDKKLLKQPGITRANKAIDFLKSKGIAKVSKLPTLATCP